MADNKPSHRLLLVSERLDRYGKPKPEFTSIGGMWTNEKGNISGTIPAGMFLIGRIVLVPVSDDEDGAETNAPDFALSET